MCSLLLSRVANSFPRYIYIFFIAIRENELRKSSQRIAIRKKVVLTSENLHSLQGSVAWMSKCFEMNKTLSANFSSHRFFFTLSTYEGWNYEIHLDLGAFSTCICIFCKIGFFSSWSIKLNMCAFDTATLTYSSLLSYVKLTCILSCVNNGCL